MAPFVHRLLHRQFAVMKHIDVMRDRASPRASGAAPATKLSGDRCAAKSRSARD
jgi:hypothetical protein